ncbi:MAG: hypothetical protein IJC25_03585 [Clostridia bacterium]|nr:hypothetical protein [Clostridia bacterium]
MTDRENFFALMNGRPFERVPYILMLCNQLQEKLREQRGVTDYWEYYDIPIRYAGIAPTQHPVDYSPYFKGKDIDYFTEWGDGHKYGSVEHFTHFVPCMDTFETPEEVYAFPLPDVLADYRWEGFAQRVAELKAADRIVVGSPAIQIFEPAWYLRGMETMLEDFYLRPEMARACLERLLPVKREIAVRLAEADVDVIVYGDDVAMQTGMMMSPAVWREFLKPLLADVIAAAKAVKPDVLVYYHTDGDCTAIIDDLIEVGVEILNPVQPECLDPLAVYENYHDRLAVWGAIGTQTTMPFGTPEQVRSKTTELLQAACRHGKMVLAPTHLLEPEVPLENIDTFVKTVREFRA